MIVHTVHKNCSVKGNTHHISYKNADSIRTLQEGDAQLVLDRLLLQFDGYEFGWCCGGKNEFTNFVNRNCSRGGLAG